MWSTSSLAELEERRGEAQDLAVGVSTVFPDARLLAEFIIETSA
jgi:hypothetical protein